MTYEADCNDMKWITYRLYDDLDDGRTYETSETFTIVFNKLPLAGDLILDGDVDIADLSRLCDFWLASDSSVPNDYYERADTNRDGFVNMHDFALLASNWLMPPQIKQEN